MVIVFVEMSVHFLRFGLYRIDEPHVVRVTVIVIDAQHLQIVHVQRRQQHAGALGGEHSVALPPQVIFAFFMVMIEVSVDHDPRIPERLVH